MTFFGKKIYSGFITLNDAFEEQINLKKENNNFNQYNNRKHQNAKKEKVLTYKNADRPFKEEKKFLIVLKTK